MFPTTVWSTIREAAEREPAALEQLARAYRPAVRAFLRQRGFSDVDADDLCQDVFLRLLSSTTLDRVDPSRGRFRSLLLAITRHVVLDHRRRRAPLALDELVEPAERDPDFDRLWILHLAEIGLERLREEGSIYYDVLCQHLAGQGQDRNRLWNARRRLIACIRREIALTCATHEEFEEEAAYLSRFLRPAAERDSGENL